MDETELYYLAGIFDGEGSVSITHRRSNKTEWNPSYSLRAGVTNTNEAVCLRFAELFGGWVRIEKATAKRVCYRWWVSDLRAVKAIEKLRPALKIKANQASLALQFAADKAVGREVKGGPNKGHGWWRTPESAERLKSHWVNMMALNRGETVEPTWLLGTAQGSGQESQTIEAKRLAADRDYWKAYEGLAFTTITPSVSSPSPPAETLSGPVEQSSECAHSWRFTYPIWQFEDVPLKGTGWCQKCHVSQLFELTPVPVAQPTTSTSPKQPSATSPDTSTAETIPPPGLIASTGSELSESTEGLGSSRPAYRTVEHG